MINKYETLHSTINGLAKQVTGRLGPAYKAPERAPGAPGDAEPDQPPLPVVVQNSSSGYLETAKLILEPILSPLSTLAIVLIVTIFVLVRQEDLRDRLIRLFGSNDLHRTTLAIDDATERLTRYFLTQGRKVQRKPGVLIGFGLFLIGLPSPILLGPSRGATAIRSLCGCDNRRGTSCGAGRRRRSRLVHGALDSRAFHRRRGRNRPNPGAGALWQQHRPVSDGSGYRRHFLELDLGTDRSYPVDASDAFASAVLGRHVRRASSSLTCSWGIVSALTPVETLSSETARRRSGRSPGPSGWAAERARPFLFHYGDIALKALRLVANDLSRGVTSARAARERSRT